MPIDLLQRRADCLAQHLGVWSVQPEWLRTMTAAVNAGMRGDGAFAWLHTENREVAAAIAAGRRVQTSAADEPALGNPEAAAAEVRERKKRPFMLDESGIAVIEISGPMMKGYSKFVENTNTVQVRRQLRAAMTDTEVHGIMLVIDSPGGTVAGTAELANDVRAAAETKPLRVHADDLMASAAFWVASAAHRITASPTSEVGSIGTLLVVHDTSEKFATEGVKVHVISTGTQKGAGVAGSEITDEHLAAFRERVDDLNAHFLRAVTDSRRLTGKRLEAVTDGRVFIAQKAHALGLVDGVESSDAAFDAFRRSLARTRRQRGTRAALIDAELRAAES